MIVLEQEICDCLSCQGNGWVLRSSCGCDEYICEVCGYCLLCCDADGNHDDDWMYDGQGDDD